VRGFEPPTAGTQKEPGNGPRSSDADKTASSEPSASRPGLPSGADLGALSDRYVRSELPLGERSRLLALLNRALAELPHPSHARDLVLDAVRLLESSVATDIAVSDSTA
jgi:hypothetical protein